MTIAAILDGKGTDVVSIDADESVRRAVEQLAGRRIGCLPVLKDGVVLGIFSERDLLYRLADDGPGVLDRPVGEVMTAPAHVVGRNTAIVAALSQMTRRRFRHLPVVEEGRLVGIVSIGDLVKYRIDAIEAEAAAMRDYIRTA